MYCKKCGKKLPENSRFCDRCGQPTYSQARKNTSRGKNESVRKTDSYDRYRKKKMQQETQKKKRQQQTRKIAVISIVFALLAAVAAGYGTYYMTMKNIEKDKNATASASPSATQSQSVPEKNEKFESDEKSGNSEYNIYIDKAYGFKCAYPSSFEVGTLASSNTKLSLMDPDGDAQMLICCEKVNESRSASVLLRDYVKGLGVEPDFNRATDSGYEVTFTRNDKINHRKAVILDKALVVYYDFSFAADSDRKSKYSGYIDYIDEYFDKDLNKSAGEEKTTNAPKKTVSSSADEDDE